MGYYDDVNSLSRKMKIFVYNMDSTTMVIVLIIVAVVSVIMNAVNESVITTPMVMTFFITTIGLYIYFKKQYSSKIKELKVKNRMLKKDSILDEMCRNKKTRNTELCNKYQTSKRNFYTISNMLLQKYNIDS